MIDKRIMKQAAEVSKTDPSRAYDMIEKTAGGSTLAHAIFPFQKEIALLFARKAHKKVIRAADAGDACQYEFTFGFPLATGTLKLMVSIANGCDVNCALFLEGTSLEDVICDETFSADTDAGKISDTLYAKYSAAGY